MDTKKIWDYLAALEANNNREWYHAHKSEKEEAQGSFYGLLDALRDALEDPEIIWPAKDYCYRLMRDARFSKGQPPYFPAFRAHLTAQRKKFIPVGYYISLQPGGHSFIGLGLAAPNISTATAVIRSRIASHCQEWLQIVENPIFAGYFSPLHGEKLQKTPKEYAGSPCGEYLKYKSWYTEYAYQDETVLSGSTFVKDAAEKFKIMKPFKEFLNEALKNWKP